MLSTRKSSTEYLFLGSKACQIFSFVKRFSAINICSTKPSILHSGSPGDTFLKQVLVDLKKVICFDTIRIQLMDPGLKLSS
jgi:hypothetical protein